MTDATSKTWLAGKTILVGVTGGIAAYKACELVRLLTGAGADVHVVMTATAREFVGPLTFQALTGHPTHTDLFDPAQEAAMGHIQLARWAELVIVAPASADALAKAAHGLAPDLLHTLLLATTAPVLFAPAMNTQMWLHPATQANTAILAARPRVHFVGPAAGDLACGEIGAGRLAEPPAIVAAAIEVLGAPTPARGEDLAGLHVLITAGPTAEPIDPVRVLTNRSSGKMGYALAEAALARGATATLVTGPVALPPPVSPAPGRLAIVHAPTAAAMFDEVMARKDTIDVFIGAAAIADYTVAEPARSKIKKHADTLVLELVKTRDVLAELGRVAPRAFKVGFAAETDSLIEHSRKKLAAKGCDLIVANDVSEPGAGFDVDTNRVTILSRRLHLEADHPIEPWPHLSKRETADRILDVVVAERAHKLAVAA
jgi:phosphopantothenoylcysteine decarboxylase / phosphopantothenate---cysteine ligase